MTGTDERLFSAIEVEHRRYLADRKAEAGRAILSFPLSETYRLGQAVFNNLHSGGVCTLVVTDRPDWDPTDHYYEAARLSARQGRRIHRAFLLPHRQNQHDPALQEHARLDSDAGITVSLLYVGDLLSSYEFASHQGMEFGLWDDAVGCIGMPSPSGMRAGLMEWKVTSRPEDLQSLRDTWRLLVSKAVELPMTTPEGAESPPDLEEPMVISAPLAQELAGVLCLGDHVSPEDCSWYHSVWQYLRIFNMVSTPTWHTRFYFNAISGAADETGGAPLLVSGTADYSMLAHAIWAYQRRGFVPRVTVLDLCETPLLLCKWYAKRAGVKISTTAADIMTFGPPESVGVIATDAFLTRFSPSERVGVIENWRNLLTAPGVIVTTVRLEKGLSQHKLLSASPEQVERFSRRALDEAVRWRDFLPCSPEHIATLARRYAERMVSHSFISVEEVENLFRDGGLTVSQLDLVEVPGEMVSTTYAEIVARK